jgi:hypothetical protein
LFGLLEFLPRTGAALAFEIWNTTVLLIRFELLTGSAELTVTPKANPLHGWGELVLSRPLRRN